MRISDWSSDVCSSDLLAAVRASERPVAVLVLAPRAAGAWRVAADAVRPGRDFLFGEVARRRDLERRHARGHQSQRPCIDIAAVVLAGERIEMRGDELRRRRRGRRSEEHTSELQSLMRISYAVFCL